jgi:hypothetical protein
MLGEGHAAASDSRQELGILVDAEDLESAVGEAQGEW